MHYDSIRVGVTLARFAGGDTSLHHEEANGRRITQTVGRLIELARQFADHVNALRTETGYQPMLKAEQIPIKVDDGGAIWALVSPISSW